MEHERVLAVTPADLVHLEQHDDVVARDDLLVQRAVVGRDGLVEQHRAVPVTLNGRPAKRSSRGPASCRHTASWWSASTLMPRWSASRSSGHVELEVAMENDTSGGSMLTEVNDDAAIPVSWPFTDAATATTPEGKAPNASRRVRWSRPGRTVGGTGRVGHADTPPGRAVERAGRQELCAVANHASYVSGRSCSESRT